MPTQASRYRTTNFAPSTKLVVVPNDPSEPQVPAYRVQETCTIGNTSGVSFTVTLETTYPFPAELCVAPPMSAAELKKAAQFIDSRAGKQSKTSRVLKQLLAEVDYWRGLHNQRIKEFLEAR